jgi:hypothetical protein
LDDPVDKIKKKIKIFPFLIHQSNWMELWSTAEVKEARPFARLGHSTTLLPDDQLFLFGTLSKILNSQVDIMEILEQMIHFFMTSKRKNGFLQQ